MEPSTQTRRRRAERYQAETSAPAESSTPAQAFATKEAPAEPPVQAPQPEHPPEPMARHKLPTRPRGAKGISARRVSPRMPLWLSVALVTCVAVIGLLFAGDCMMRGYLTQRRQEREAAYQRVVNGHPLDYRNLIERYAEENNLRPAFVAAVILNESSFRTEAESSVGARGLMQLMPDTAEWIAGKLDVEGYSFARMYDAESNIRFGTWYLGYLGEMFRGDPVLVACAFHAGQGEVRGWLSDPSLSADGVTILLENLSDGPTKTYAGRVMQDYGIYEALYYGTSASDSTADSTADRAAHSRVTASVLLGAER